jgi:REP element-mobilizing transposase RayT
MVRTAAYGEVRFLTFSCERRQPLLSNPQDRAGFRGPLGSGSRAMGLSALRWVVMPEHVHLLLIPPRPGDGEPDQTERILALIK